MNLVWFRNDLRLADNPALWHAIKYKQPTVALFILNPGQHMLHGESPKKLDFIKAHVKNLCQRLKLLNVTSLVKVAPYFDDVPGVFETVLDQLPIKQVFYNKNYWPNELKRDEQVKQFFTKENVKWHEFDGYYMLPPGTVRKADGSMYHVFTPYKKRFIEQLKASYQSPLPVPDAIDYADSIIQAEVDFDHTFNSHLWPVGEKAVAEMVRQFLSAVNYKKERDYPAIEGTSRLSPYLFVGVVSAKQCLAYALKYWGEKAFDSTWVSELIWRDFYNDLMYEYPKLAKHLPFNKSANDQWLHQPELFEKWKLGQTGFPLIDAGMRQLLKEGWMHNRVRMVVASFLCKLCLVDWRLGEAHFMAQLLDGDLASNNGGWQWSSSTGCDAAPYFRIFNPTSQSIKFDKNGSYIKRYVPELQTVSEKEIHDPNPEIRAQCHYPEPMINYKAARIQALNWFKK